MTPHFQPPRWFMLANRMVAPLVRWGLPVGGRQAPMALLTVVGRRSGQLRTTPIALARHDRGWILIAVYGETDWSRNLEAAGEGSITLRGAVIEVKARRLEPEQAAPILEDAMRGAPAVVRRMTAPYFDAPVDSANVNWTLEASRHPVFLLEPLEGA